MNSTLPYHFVSLSSEQVAKRREILNRNGIYAYLTPILILGTTALVQRIRRQWNAQAIRPASEKTLTTAPTALDKVLRQTEWWLSTPVNAEFGSRRVHLLGLSYASWLLFLAFRQTTTDYLHLTKQLGHVAVAQLPLHYFLAIKSPRSPITLITGLSYETLLPYHRLFGRILHLFLLAHGVMYIYFFAQSGLLPQRLSSRAVLLGIAALAMLDILAIMATPPIRKYAYHNLFYKSHVVLSLVLLPVLFFHVPYTRTYIMQCVVIFGFNAISRKSSTSAPLLANVSSVAEGTNLIRLSIPGPATGVPPLMGPHAPGWVPGQHCYVKQAMPPTAPRSPFTIVSLSPSDEEYGMDELCKVELVMRNSGGPITGWLGKKPKEVGSDVRNVKVLIEGPYGESAAYVPNLLEKDNGDVLLVTGGVGATFTLPIYISLLQEMTRRRSGPQGHDPLIRDRKIVFVWVAKAKNEVTWGIEMIKRAGLINIKKKHGIDVDIRVYITNNPRLKAKESNRTASASTQNGVAKATGIESPLATTDPFVDYGKAKVADITTTELTQGPGLPGLRLVEDQRPDIEALVTEVFGCIAASAPSSKVSYGKVTVLACGPRSMGADLRRQVGKHVMGYGREVDFREEVFGHGGA